MKLIIAKNGFKFYENNLDKLDLLTDIEITKIMAAYDLLEDRLLYLELVDENIDDLCDTDSLNFFETGIENSGLAMKSIEDKIADEESKILSWNSVFRYLPIRNDVIRASDLRSLRESSDYTLAKYID